jgi:hypothetical protein
MAIPPEKRKLLFVKGRPSEEELNERFFKRVSYPVLRPADQEALAFNKNNELLDLIRGSKAQDKNLKADIEKRLRRALLDKEIAMDNLAQARYDNNDDLEEFYLKNIQILDDTINNTRKEYERVNLSTKYLDDLKPIKYESLTGSTRIPADFLIRKELFSKDDDEFGELSEYKEGDESVLSAIEETPKIPRGMSNNDLAEHLDSLLKPTIEARIQRLSEKGLIDPVTSSFLKKNKNKLINFIIQNREAYERLYSE